MKQKVKHIIKEAAQVLGNVPQNEQYVKDIREVQVLFKNVHLAYSAFTFPYQNFEINV